MVSYCKADDFVEEKSGLTGRGGLEAEKSKLLKAPEFKPPLHSCG